MSTTETPYKELPIGTFRRAEYNPRIELRPGDPSYERLKNSVATFGLIDPLVGNERTGNLVGGHQRLSVLEELGRTTAWHYVVDVDEQEERALNLALNAVQGEWDKDKLLQVVYSLEEDYVRYAFDSTAEVEAMLRATEITSSFDEDAGENFPGTGLPSDYFELSLVLDPEQHRVYREATAKAKTLYGVDSQPDAMALVCEAFLR